MIKARNKKISLILVLAMVMTMFAGLGTAAAADFTFSEAFTKIAAEDGQNIGYFSVGEDAKVPAKAGEDIFLTVELPDGVDFATTPAINDIDLVGGTGATVEVITSSDNSVQYKVYGTTSNVTELAWNLNDTIKVNIDSGFDGNLNVTATVDVIKGNVHIWNKTWTPKVAWVGDGQATITGKTAKSYGKAPLTGVDVAAVELSENQAGVLDPAAQDIVTVSLEQNGVTFDLSSAPAVIGAAGGLQLTRIGATPAGAPDTINYLVSNKSTGVGGKVNLLEGVKINAKPGVEGDISVLVSSTKTSKISDTSAVIATIGTGEFKVTAKDTKDRNCPQGWRDKQIGKVEVDPSGAFDARSTIEFTLKGAKFDKESFTDLESAATVKGGKWKVGGLYNNDRSIWFTLADGATDSDLRATATFSFPKVIADADATPGALVMTIGGNAGVEGEAVVGNILPSVLPAAEKKVVQADAINQLAGDIVLKEFFKGSFGHNCGTSDYLTLDLPNGVYFAGTPDVYVNGEEVDVVVKDGTGRGYSKISFEATGDLVNELSSGRIDTVVIKNVKYDVDSRFAAQEIPVKISGTFFTGGNGSTDTIATVANAIGESKASGVGILTLGSTTYVKNGVEMQMDVAPYAKNNRTYMPIRYVANILGIDDNNIIWDQNNKTVTMMKGDKVVQVKLGSNQMLINGVPVTMDVSVEASNNRTFLPVRWIAQAFGAQVDWDQAGQTVTIRY